jgi:hypothetical protein
LIHTKQRHKTRHRKTVDVSLFEDVYVNTVGSYISTVFMCDLIMDVVFGVVNGAIFEEGTRISCVNLSSDWTRQSN